MAGSTGIFVNPAPAETLHTHGVNRDEGPWFRQVTPDQWKAFTGSYLAWVLDGFDYTILQFLLIDIQRSFTVNKALAGASARDRFRPDAERLLGRLSDLSFRV